MINTITDISEYSSPSEDFIRNHPNEVEWHLIASPLSEPFIREFIDRLNIMSISRTQRLTYRFMRDFAEKLDWKYVSMKLLRHSFIREFQDRVDWNHISIYQKITNAFIEEFQDRINWRYIIMYQRHLLSSGFINTYRKWIYPHRETLQHYFYKKLNKVRILGLIDGISEDIVLHITCYV